MNPNAPNATLQYDRVKFAGGILSPGLCEIEGAALNNKWDIRAGYGIIGGTAWFTGTELSEFSITFRLYDDRDWEDWEAIAPLFKTRQRTPSWKGLEIEHPQLQEVGITAVVVKKVSQPVKEDDTGIWSIKIDFIEYPKRPQLKAAKVDGAQAEPVDPIEAQTDAALKGVKERLKQLGIGDG
jgi:hypothetical protein